MIYGICKYVDFHFSRTGQASGAIIRRFSVTVFTGASLVFPDLAMVIVSRSYYLSCSRKRYVEGEVSSNAFVLHSSC